MTKSKPHEISFSISKWVFVRTQQTDEGIKPNIYIKLNSEDIGKGVDTELEEVKKLIANANQG